MDFGEKDVKKMSIILLVAVLVVLAFLVVRPFLVPILGGLLLAYVFMPVYKKINHYVKNKSLVASIVSIIILAIVFAVLWFTTPLLIKQGFEVLTAIQKLDIQSVVVKIFPTASPAFADQLTVILSNAINKAFSVGANSITGFLTNLPKILLNFFILGFIFFFALRDSDKLKEFAKGISPLNESKEKIVAKHFKDMTSAVIYGWVIVGIIQGTLAGIGFFLFGVKNALILTVLAIFLSIIPFLGPAFIWVPVAIFLLTQGNIPTAVGYVLYNVLIVSLVDNIIRSYIISRKTNVSPAIILVGMVGGLFVFGIVGIIVGPLVLAYLLTLLESFKDKSIYALFA